METTVFAGRNFKEMIRDPISIMMGLGFPVLLIVALSLMKRSIGEMADIFEVANFAPSMTVFGLSFLGMFVGTLMSADKKSSFLSRLFATPLKSKDYILGYALPIFPLAIAQSICCFGVAAIFGMKIGINILVAVGTLIPIAIFFVSFGLFMGSVLPSANAVNGMGTILVNASVFLSSAVIPLETIGGTFQKVCDLLPFVHGVNAVRYAVSGDYDRILPHIVWVLGYALLLFLPAVLVFKKQMR